MADITSPQRQYTQDYYQYAVNFGNIATTVSVQQSLQIDADSAFDWRMTTVAGYLHGSVDTQLDSTILPLTITVQDGGSGRLLTNQPIPIQSIAGTGKQPFILPVPRIFAPKSTIIFSCTSPYSAATYDNITLTLIGRKIFNVTANDLQSAMMGPING